MGGVVPKGLNNEELVDNLVAVGYIQKPEIENVFRAVDRGDFFPGEYIEDAYKDLAMKHGNLHLSAPCIYSEVLDNFEMTKGLSFLNIGSGTGYLSTLVGLLIGANGINHGIDLYADVIEFANKNVDEFIRFSDEFDGINFCKPVFVQGNAHCLSNHRRYDRVYCGACVPNIEIKNNLQKHVSIGGIMIYPYGENLVKAQHVSETEWEESSLLHVQFADLINKEAEDISEIELYSQPHTLKEISRFAILKCITKENLESLNLLPLPNVLIQYLKYYRDPSIPKPHRERKTRGPEDEEIGFQVVAIR